MEPGYDVPTREPYSYERAAAEWTAAKEKLEVAQEQMRKAEAQYHEAVTAEKATRQRLREEMGDLPMPPSNVGATRGR